jgi:hypothetical protein
MDTKLDFPIENPSVFGAEKFKINGWVVAAHFTPASYLPMCSDFFYIALRNLLFAKKVRYEESNFIWRCGGTGKGWWWLVTAEIWGLMETFSL